jgi:hypothetical protein
MSAVYDITAENLRLAGYRELHAGDDYDHQFTVQRAGAALSLVGATIWFTIKDSSLQSDAQALLQLSSAESAQIEITDAAGGVFLVKFRGTGTKSTADLEGLWKYDIQVKLAAPSSTIITVARGDIEFLDNLTRSTS